MILISTLSIIFVAVLHIWFLTLEMFLWQKPIGMKVFRLSPEFAKQSAALAANQGLYNGILSAGLWVSLFLTPPINFAFKVFFLMAIIVAGVFVALTVNRKIFWIQALPAMVALGLVLLAI